MSALFTPLQLGAIRLSHRIIMAPLTRFRADLNFVHHEIAAEYYEQRATSGGLIISEGTLISDETAGFLNVPGIWNDEQITAWKAVTERVHAKGGFMFCQLWALGRAGDAEVIRSRGLRLVGPSPIAQEGGETPEEMTREDINRYVEAYAQAARNAIKAGFDGVEFHGANGYLIDQFLQSNSNQRTDEFGGSDENRARFLLLVTQAVADAIGEDRIGVRFSPYSPLKSMRMADPTLMFGYVTQQLRDRFPRISYTHFVEGRVAGIGDRAAPASENSDFARTIWNAKGERGFLSAGGYGYNADLAEKTVEAHGGAAVFGRAFTSNPDLVHRIRNKLPLAPYDRSKFYFPKGPTGSDGYSDYPTAEAVP